MSLIDPECYPELHGDDRRVCAACFGDTDLQAMIRAAGEYGACDFCGTRRAKTVEFSYVADHIVDRAGAFYGNAVEQLPYDSGEGGWQGGNFDSYDLVQDEIGLDLPRDSSGELFQAVVDALGEDQWCAYDWTRLELDRSLDSSWSSFANTVMHRRRFFFHGKGDDGHDPGDDRSPMQLFGELRDSLKRLGRLKTKPAGYALFRARERGPGERHHTPAALGPPPEEFALQSNRMNPPGIPMFYGAENARLAMAEVRSRRVSLGRFETTRPIRIIDLVDLPPILGFFSTASRPRRQYLSFLHAFARRISLPVPRNDRTNVNYLPTQVFTEFLRDADFDGRRVDGIRYPSATGEGGSNVVLFATQTDVVGAFGSEEDLRGFKPWLRLTGVVQKRGSDA